MSVGCSTVTGVLVLDDRVVYSASDLARGAGCEYALLRQFDAKLGWGPALTADPFSAHLARLGREHEQRQLDRLRDRFGDGVSAIGRPSFTHEGLAAAVEQTLRAVADGVPVLYQAAMFDGRLVGFADFLVRDGARYRVRDAKLKRSAVTPLLLQVTAYADTLSQAGVPVSDDVELILGDGRLVAHRIDELVPDYVARRERVQRLLDDHLTGGVRACWGDPGVQACLRCELCCEQLDNHDDVLLVAGVSIKRRAKLSDAGIHTVADLAGHRGPVPNLASNVTDTLTAQAKLQLRQRDTGVAQFEIVDPAQLAALPRPDDGDLFVDFEGDNMWTGANGELGLEYLFGTLDSAGGFRPLWAHNRADERTALIDFLALMRDRHSRHPNMHIYHYGDYEKTALRRLANRHGLGADTVDDLIGSGTLVDLYPVVRNGIRIGTGSIGLKKLEPLYMGDELRQGAVTTGNQSMIQYGRFCALRTEGRAAEAASVLQEIEDHNRYDCRSAHRLRDWLLQRASDQTLSSE